MPTGSCATRTIKEGRFLLARHPELIGTEEPAEGFSSVLEGSDPYLRYQLRAALDPGGFRAAPNLRTGRGAPARMRVSAVAPQGAGATAPPVDEGALRSVTEFLRRAFPILSPDLPDVGPPGPRIESGPLLSVPAVRGRFNDAAVRIALAPALATAAPGDRGIWILLHGPGSTNTDADSDRSVLGYHAEAAGTAYAFVNVGDPGPTSPDRNEGFQDALGHVLADALDDPAADLGRAERCAAEGSDASSRAFFDSEGRLLRVSTEPPLNVDAAFYLPRWAVPSAVLRTLGSP